MKCKEMTKEMGSIIDGTYRGYVRGPILITASVCGYKVCLFPANLVAKLLARVLKDGVQFWYNDTSTVKGGGGGGGEGWRKRSSGKSLKFTLLHISICSKLVRNFSNTHGFVSLCRYASLLHYDIFIQPGTPSN